MITHGEQWKTGYATYHGIDGRFAKAVFTRLHTGGSAQPDAEAGSGTPSDRLPCLLELQHTIRKAHEFVSANDPTYHDIFSLPTVQSRPRPSVSAFAIYTQQLMCVGLKMIRSSVAATDLQIMAYVFDSVYVIADSQGLLEKSFSSIATELWTKHGLKVALKTADGVKLLT